MALKKSDLYSSLWASCDELRGGMDASQYKDYVLVFLFLKYVSDKYAGKPFAPLKIPAGSTFADMVALKGSKDIGDQINKRIIAPLADANDQLSLNDFPDFNDATKLGSGKEMVDRLTNLIGIFQSPGLDFSKNRADGDDILGDWHTHPDGSDRLSVADRKTLKAISGCREARIENPLMVILWGREKWGVTAWRGWRSRTVFRLRKFTISRVDVVESTSLDGLASW